MTTITRTDALADALERFDGFGYLDAPGFAFHGPMGAETLSTLGHDDLVASWVESYKARHHPLDPAPTSSRIDLTDEPDWRAALGDMSRVSDWAALFGAELRDQPWPMVLRRWIPVLLPGAAGAMAHGLLRVAHGVRALPREGEPPGVLLDELARGLAFWAATFKALPGRPTLLGSLALPTAIAQLPRPNPPWATFEAGTFSRIGELATFPEAVEALGPPASTAGALSDLITVFCQTLLAHPEVFPLPLVHTVTPAAALRTLLPHVPDITVRAAYSQLWHTSAAIVSAFTTHATPADPSSLQPIEAPRPDEIVARAVEHRDSHALKFAEACVREHDLRPDPAYLVAAQHVLAQLPAW